MSDDPYLTPAHTTAASLAPVDRRDQTKLWVGIALALLWPVLFSLRICTDSGLMGMACGVTTLLLAVDAGRRSGMIDTERLARGLLVFALMCLLPIIPVIGGGILTSLVASLFRDSDDAFHGFTFAPAFVLTLAVGAGYLLPAYGIGSIGRPAGLRVDDDRV